VLELELELAPFLNRLCAVFPPEVSGLVIFMIGLSGGIAGRLSLLGPHAAPMLPADWIVGIVTLGTMIALNVWGKGPASMFCAPDRPGGGLYRVRSDRSHRQPLRVRRGHDFVDRAAGDQL